MLLSRSILSALVVLAASTACMTEMELGSGPGSASLVAGEAWQCGSDMEICGNGADDDCDGKADCEDTDCAEHRSCGCQPAEFETCDNRLDDDCNGTVDCADPGCANDPACRRCNPTGTAETCGNGVDDDCDEATDCDDRDCDEDAACRVCTAPGSETCDNRLDDDCDGLVDCADSDCANHEHCRTCTPRAEACGNGADDDCDELVDCLDPDCSQADRCVNDCTETEGNNCGGDPGYGDHCAAEDNSGGCSPDRFWAWCNRRNSAYPDIWYGYLRTWVDDRCDGAVELTDENYALFHCDGSDGRRWQCRTPLVILLDPARRVAYRAYDGFARFDVSGRGDPSGHRHDWPTAATPWLAIDLDGNGRIDSGRELLGSGSPGAPRNGFAALAAHDANHDGVLDARDPAFARLLAWSDNGDRVSQPAELVPVSALGILKFNLAYTTGATCDGRGNCEVERAGMTWRDPAGGTRTGAVVDVHLRVQAESPLFACVLP
ncbi:MAG: hypothetical protein HY904_09190 [Deltaproteobacteria bacterium]|nr:hypothetical protein [Deltaproteobacteria bacterium]